MKKKKKKRKKFKEGKIIMVLSFILMLSIGFGVLLKSSLFEVKKINITGNKHIIKEDVIKYANIKTNKNIFTYNIKKIEKKLMENPYIKNVNIKMNYPDKINISITENEIAALIRNDKTYCYINENGDLIEKIKDIKGEDNKIIVDVEYGINKDNKLIFKNEDEKKRLLYLLNLLKDNHLDKKITEVDFSEKSIIYMKTIDNTKILLPKDDNIDYNISRTSNIIIDLQNKKLKSGTIDLISYDKYALYSPE